MVVPQRITISLYNSSALQIYGDWSQTVPFCPTRGPGGGEEKPRRLPLATVAPITGRHRRARQGQQKHLTPLVSLLLDNVLCLNHARDLG